jgi:hypothetical protein
VIISLDAQRGLIYSGIGKGAATMKNWVGYQYSPSQYSGDRRLFLFILPTPCSPLHNS